MIKRNAAKPQVRVVPPHDGGTEVSTSTLQELLEKRGNRLKSHIQQKEEKRESASLTRVSRTALSGIRHSANVKFRSSQLADIRFENCDLSNISFAESCLYRVEFISCKLLGTNLSETTMNHVLLHDCNASLHQSGDEQNESGTLRTAISGTEVSMTAVSSSVAFDSCDLVETDFSCSAPWNRPAYFAHRRNNT